MHENETGLGYRVTDLCEQGGTAYGKAAGPGDRLSDNVKKALVSERAVVVVVEDDVFIRDIIKRLLREAIPQVFTYEHPAEALDAMFDQNQGQIKIMPHFVLTDVLMPPHMTGSGFLQELDGIYDSLSVSSSTRPAYGVMTGFFDEHTAPGAATFFESRQIPVINKPFNLDDLTAMVLNPLMRHPRIIGK
jgi:CheY-like chemotaxis protein